MSRSKRPTPLEADLLELAETADVTVVPRASLRETLLATVSDERRYEGFVDRLATFLDFDPERTRSLLGRLRSGVDDTWEEGRVEGVRLFHFDGGPRVASAHCGLVRVDPGVTYPLHRHQGDEWAFVLQGTAREDDGRVLAPGDLLHNLPGSRHAFTAEGPEPFVFVVVLHAGIEHL
jgi:quercetin dioxygenase-like cupin family protein